MIRPAFHQSRRLWEQDGSLRDVYVAGATTSDWEALVELASKHGYRYSRNGTENSISEVAEILCDRASTHLLEIAIGRVKANCHFFTPEEIELDIDPREVHDAADHNDVLQFIEVLAKSTLKTTRITEENAPALLYLSYEPLSQAWTIHESLRAQQ